MPRAAAIVDANANTGTKRLRLFGSRTQCPETLSEALITRRGPQRPYATWRRRRAATCPSCCGQFGAALHDMHRYIPKNRMRSAMAASPSEPPSNKTYCKSSMKNLWSKRPAPCGSGLRHHCCCLGFGSIGRARQPDLQPQLATKRDDSCLARCCQRFAISRQTMIRGA